MATCQATQKAADKQRGLIAWFANHPVAANLLMVMLILGGLLSVLTIKQELIPEIELDMIQASVVYKGATPREVEEGILLKMEQAVRDIDGIKDFYATASEGYGNLVINVHTGADTQRVLDKVKQEIDAISTFPPDIEKPQVSQIEIRNTVLYVQLLGALDERSMKQEILALRNEMLGDTLANSIEIMGARDYEITIDLSEAKLREYGLSFDQVAQQIRAFSIDLPGGTIRTGQGEIQLRTDGLVRSGEGFAEIVLQTHADGSQLTLGDIATINDGFVEKSRFLTFDGQSSLALAIKSTDAANDNALASSVREFVERKQLELPPGLSLSYWGDSSFYLEDRINLMLSNVWSGCLLVFVSLALFLRVRLAFWVMMGLPVCFLGTLLFMPLGGVSLNMVSLFAFIVVLGIVVDDAIVTGESVHSEVEARGFSIDAVVAGAKRVAMPATFGVLTTVAAFSPLLMVGGSMGAMTKPLGAVVILCLLFSLLESKLILPAHLAHMKQDKPGSVSPMARLRRLIDRSLNGFIHRLYSPLLSLALSWRYSTLTAFIGLFVLLLTVMSTGWVRTVMFPDVPMDFLQMEVTMEDGTPREQTIHALEQATDAVYRADQALGGGLIHHVMTTNGRDETGFVVVEMHKQLPDHVNSEDLARQWRAELPAVSGLKKAALMSSTHMGSGAPLAFRLEGDDLDRLQQAANQLKAYLATFNGVYEIEDNAGGGKLELRLALKPAAASLGVTLSDLARQVRQGFYGDEVQTVPRGEEDVPVMLRYPSTERESVGNLEQMRIRTAAGNQVPFSEVASYTLEPGLSWINRQDGQRNITVSAQVDNTLVEPGRLARDIGEEYLPQLLEAYPGVEYALAGSSEDELILYLDLLKGAVLALVLIYALMAIPLNSYSQPLIIMSVIPFGLIGAVIGHALLGMTMTALSFFGMLALSGVVVNDSLILVDFVNRARAAGVPLRDAVERAGARRFRAILLTSVTTFVGLVPMMMETSFQAQFMIPMAVSIAFGILFATVITLLLVPTLYLILDDLAGVRQRAKAGLRSLYGRRPEPVA